jgi:hypothetical protein
MWAASGHAQTVFPISENDVDASGTVLMCPKSNIYAPARNVPPLARRFAAKLISEGANAVRIVSKASHMQRGARHGSDGCVARNGQLHDFPCRSETTEAAIGRRMKWRAPTSVCVGFRRVVHRDCAERTVLVKKHIAKVCAANADRILKHRVEYRL